MKDGGLHNPHHPPLLVRRKGRLRMSRRIGEGCVPDPRGCREQKTQEVWGISMLFAYEMRCLKLGAIVPCQAALKPCPGSPDRNPEEVGVRTRFGQLVGVAEAAGR